MQARARDVAGVNLAGRSHGRCHRQRLAAGARTKIDHRLATARLGELDQPLAAGILDLEPALLENVEPLDCRLADQPHRSGRLGQRFGRNTLRSQRAHQCLAVGLDQIDPQIERRRPKQHLAELLEGIDRIGLTLTRQLVEQLGMEPVGQTQPDCLRQGRRIGTQQSANRQETLGRQTECGEHLLTKSGGQREHHQAPGQRTPQPLGKMAVATPVAKDVEGGFGNHAAIAPPELLVAAEIASQCQIGRPFQTQDQRQRPLDRLEQKTGQAWRIGR